MSVMMGGCVEYRRKKCNSFAFHILVKYLMAILALKALKWEGVSYSLPIAISVSYISQPTSGLYPLMPSVHML